MSETYTNEGKTFERSSSAVRRMISEIEDGHVRILNNNTDLKRNRVPVIRVQSRDKIRLLKSELFGNVEQNLSSSQPSMLHTISLEHTNVNELSSGVVLRTEDNSITTSIVSHPENNEVCSKITLCCRLRS